ncbi:alpha-glucuronidase family glycosyl hydrolase [Cloacibacterium rupense]|uniref:alpha-glucuronidase family glycosyl hydrolase n=1 Tax=Cloacibacterium rupense TaxID=517423 RepID=UPI001664B182|nr:alpha-glucuronidase family glycosyl hydrolase [Cloacibacterium rupense]
MNYFYKKLILPLFTVLLLCNSFTASAQITKDYDLWLQYQKSSVANDIFKNIALNTKDETNKAIQDELKTASERMFQYSPTFSNSGNATLIIKKFSELEPTQKNIINKANALNDEGFAIETIQNKGKKTVLITAKNSLGLLYGTFRLLRELQIDPSKKHFSIADEPKLKVRMLNHWDNLDGTVERGYAGSSIWNWQKLPDFIDKKYIDYARANASVGINGVALINVNSNALILTPQYLEKVSALAKAFRPYGIKVYLTARFSAPIEIGGLKTADPLNQEVQQWWNNKVNEIYKFIPDFGGFLVKANSEGQPGPQNYGRNHVDGANMMAKALQPHHGIVLWRAFVYSETDSSDRAKQAYSEFVPYDGKFEDNVLVQVKNGAIDFQPREPFHPMFGAMPKSKLMMEYQITQEYLGFSSHLVFLPKLYEEVLESDTYKQGKGSTVAKIIEGKPNELSGMAGVANIGSDLNWTGHPFAQANWYGFGRLAWNPELSSEKIAEEWLQQTFSKDSNFVKTISKIMLQSRESVVKYMTPLGLHHIMATNHHYGPGPWVNDLARPEWNPVYYHKADKNGIGFDRTATGSNALAQYSPEIAQYYGDLKTCPEEYLLWFHHLPWDYKMKNGKILWDNLGIKYQEGVNEVKNMITTWESAKPYIDAERHQEVAQLLTIQLKEAIWWKDACMTYFQTFSNLPFPKEMETPKHDLEYYKSLQFPFAPGIKPHW